MKLKKKKHKQENEILPSFFFKKKNLFSLFPLQSDFPKELSALVPLPPIPPPATPASVSPVWILPHSVTEIASAKIPSDLQVATLCLCLSHALSSVLSLESGTRYTSRSLTGDEQTTHSRSRDSSQLFTLPCLGALSDVTIAPLTKVEYLPHSAVLGLARGVGAKVTLCMIGQQGRGKSDAVHE